MTNVTKQGREELQEAYHTATSTKEIHYHPHIELDNGDHVVCEVFKNGTVYIESYSHRKDASDIIDTSSISKGKFVKKALKIIE